MNSPVHSLCCHCPRSGTYLSPTLASIAPMDTRRDPATLYSYPSHHSTWSPSVVSQSHSIPLHNPQQYPPQLPGQAIHQEQMLDAMIRQGCQHDYSCSRDPNPPTSYSPRQSMPPIVANPHLYNNDYRGSSESQRPQATQMAYGQPQTQYVPQSPIDGSMQYPASPPRPFACDMCALSFNRQHDLKRHRDTHTGDKPFLCESCGKTFTRKDALKRHQVRVHVPPSCGASVDQRTLDRQEVRSTETGIMHFHLLSSQRR